MGKHIVNGIFDLGYLIGSLKQTVSTIVAGLVLVFFIVLIIASLFGNKNNGNISGFTTSTYELASISGSNPDRVGNASIGDDAQPTFLGKFKNAEQTEMDSFYKIHLTDDKMEITNLDGQVVATITITDTELDTPDVIPFVKFIGLKANKYTVAGITANDPVFSVMNSGPAVIYGLASDKYLYNLYNANFNLIFVPIEQPEPITLDFGFETSL
jgi:hypothetical protein